MAEEKKNSEKASSIERLPNDLSFDVLLRLDVRSLMQCLLVCKSWSKIIRDTQFVNKHHDESMVRNSCRLLFVGHHYLRRSQSAHHQFRQFTGHRPIVTFQTVDPNTNNSSVDKKGGDHINRVTCSQFQLKFCLPICCDLLCFVSDEMVQLWNPLNGKFYILKRPPTKPPRSPLTMVFGYVSSKREYILVEMVEGGEGMVAHMFVLDILNSASPSWKLLPWKVIEEICPRDVHEGVFVNTFIYWVIRRDDYHMHPNFRRKKSELLVSLDIYNQKFQIINSPSEEFWESDTCLRSRYIKLIDLKGTLCLTEGIKMGLTGVFELWAWKSMANSSSSHGWMKLYNIELDFLVPFSPVIIYPKSSSSGELILREDCDKTTFYVYNPDKNTFSIVKRPPPWSSWGLYDVSVGFYWGSRLFTENPADP